MNLVVGSTGAVGSAVVRALRAVGKPVRAMVRPASDAARVASLRESGAEIVEGDLKSRSSLDVACRGVRTVISTASATVSRGPGDSIESVDHIGQLSLVDAAEAAGVSHFIYVSVIEMDGEFPLQSAKRAVEERLRHSGMSWTIIRPTQFMEVWLGPHLGFDPANGKVRIYGSGENGVSWISASDVVRFVVAAVDNSAVSNKSLDLGGPDSISPHDVVRVFEELGSRPIEIEHVPVDVLERQYVDAENSMQKTFAALMLACHAGNNVDMSEPLSLVPGELTAIRSYARRILGE